VEIQRAIEKGLDYYNIRHNDEILKKIRLYVEELGKWNEHINLTGIKNPLAIVDILLYDAFFLFGNLKESKTIIDMGSGSGILAVPISILSETCGLVKVFSVDKSLKKIQFQRHINRSLNFKGFIPIHGRIEMLEPMGADALVVKGFGTTGEILENGRKHIKPDGRAFIVKGKNETPLDAVAGFCLEEEKLYNLPFSDRVYKLIIYRKV
jgi:16S rRNA (guanine(527)-N(7))-methyltransferase RsmG